MNEVKSFQWILKFKSHSTIPAYNNYTLTTGRTNKDPYSSLINPMKNWTLEDISMSSSYRYWVNKILTFPSRPRLSNFSLEKSFHFQEADNSNEDQGFLGFLNELILVPVSISLLNRRLQKPYSQSHSTIPPYTLTTVRTNKEHWVAPHQNLLFRFGAPKDLPS